MAEGLVVQDRSGKIVMANESAASILGLSMEQLLGRDSFDPRWKATHEDGSAFPGEDHPSMVCLRTGKPVDKVIMVVETGDGRKRYIRINSHPDVDASGSVQHAVTTFTDISELKEAHAVLEKSKERIELATRAGGIGLWDWDIRRDELIWDESMFDLYGIRREDFGSAYEAWISHVHPDDVAATTSAAQDAIRNNKSYAGEFRIIRPDGSIRYILAAANAYPHEDGGPGRFIGTNIDITERKQAEQALAEKEARFRRLIETSPVPMAGNDSRLNVTFFNPAFVKLFGYSTSEVATVSDWWPKAYPDPEYRKWVQEAWMAELERARETGTPFSPMEVKIRCRNGEDKFALVWASQTLNFDEDEYLVIFVDVTRRKAAEATLKESEAKFRAYMEHAPLGIFVANREGRYVQVNPAACEMTGYSSEELLALSIPELTAPESWKAAHEQFRKVSETGSASCELAFLHKSGETRYWHLEAVRLTDDRFMAFKTDVTDRKREIEELHTLRSAVDQSANLIVITDPAGRIEYVNPSFERCTGYTSAEVIGRTPRILKSGRQDDSMYRDLWATISAGKTWRGEFMNRRKNGSFYWEAATISPIFGSLRQIQHYVAIKEDISAKKALENMLSEALEEARAAARVKSEFLAMMSHELRTPLHGVLGFAEILAATSLSEEQEEYLRHIATSGRHLLAIVNDILDFSSLEKGRITLDNGLIDVAELLDTSCLACRKEAEDKGIALSHHVDPDVPAQIPGDSRRIRQILLNLVGNAVKFTRTGAVTVSVSQAREAGRDSLDFAVRDTGPGIAPDLLARLFKPFIQADSTLHRSFEGTGLGLAISKQLSEAMGGSIEVHSIVGEGSTFTLRLPIERNPARSHETALPLSEREIARPVAEDSPHILIAEDDKISSRLMLKILNDLGYRADLALNGAEALEAFAPGKYALILMDMQMPIFDGIAVTEKIREVEAQAGARNVPILALTANVMPGDRERCMAAGMDGYLSKPIQKDELAAKVASIIRA
jgi:PAS domain S-box-containing protein